MTKDGQCICWEQIDGDKKMNLDNLFKYVKYGSRWQARILVPTQPTQPAVVYFFELAYFLAWRTQNFGPF